MAKRDKRYVHYVTLYDVEETTDSYGQPVMTTVEIGRFQADIEPISSKSREGIAMKQVWAQAGYIVTLPWLGELIPSSPTNPYREILPRMKLVIDQNAKVLEIISAVDPLYEHREWELVCSERVGATE